MTGSLRFCSRVCVRPCVCVSGMEHPCLSPLPFSRDALVSPRRLNASIHKKARPTVLVVELWEKPGQGRGECSVSGCPNTLSQPGLFSSWEGSSQEGEWRLMTGRRSLRDFQSQEGPKYNRRRGQD